MAEGRYSLRRKLHPTPKSKISKSALSKRENRTRTVSPSLQSPTPPLPPQPDFGITARSPDLDMDVFDTGEGSYGQFDDPPVSDGGNEAVNQTPRSDDVAIDPTAAQIDYWLGPGASQDIAAMCLDGDLTPDEDYVPSSVGKTPDEDFIPSSVDETPNDDFLPSSVEVSPQSDAADAEMTAPLVENPFPPLDPYPQFVFPPAVIPTPPAAILNAPAAIPNPPAAIPTDKPMGAFFRANDFGLPGRLSDNPPPHGRSPAPGITDEPAEKAVTAMEAFFRAHKFGPPGRLFDDPPPRGRSPALGMSNEPDYNAPAEDEDFLLFPGSEDSPSADDATGDVNEDRESGPRQQAGRISSPTWDLLDAGFRKIDEMIDRLANKTGRTPDNVISLWKRHHAHECAGSVWNKYQKYFLANRAKERQQIGDPKANCKTCWLGFKELEPRWREILEAYDDVLAASNFHSTISQRVRKFNALMGKLKHLSSKASEQDGFESLVVLVGNSIHEDVGLSQVYVSPGAENFLEERLRLDDDTMSGLLKNHVCNRISVGLESRIEKDLKTPADAVHVKKPQKVEQDEDSSSADEKSADEGNGTKGSNLTVTEAKTIIKSGLQEVLEPFGLNLSFESIPWTKMAASLAPAGLMVENWPRGVAFPRTAVNTKGTTIRKRHTSQGIKDLGNNGIRHFAESFGTEATRIRVVRANADQLMASKIPLYIEAPPGPGSTTNVARRGYADGHTDHVAVKPRETGRTTTRTVTLPPPHEIIEISSSPPAEHPTIAPRRTRPQTKKEKTPNSDDELIRPLKKCPKKSKKIISDSDISDDEDALEPIVITKTEKGKVTAKSVKGKGKTVTAKNSGRETPFSVTAEPAAAASNLPIAPQKPPAPSVPTITMAQTSKSTTNQLALKPISSFAAPTLPVAAANATTITMTKAKPPAVKPPGATHIKPRPIKQQPAAVLEPVDPFVVKSSSATVKGQLQGPGQAPKAHAPSQQPPQSLARPPATVQGSTMASKQSAFRPICIFDDAPPPSRSKPAPIRIFDPAPPPSMSKPASKRSADGEKLLRTAASKKLRTNVDASTSPGLGLGAPPLEGSTVDENPAPSGVEGTAPESAQQPAQSAAQGTVADPAQGYQWPYPFFPPYGFPAPPPGWGYPPWNQNQERPAGSAPDSATPVPPYLPHPYFGVPGAHGAYPALQPRPAEGEPGPSRST